MLRFSFELLAEDRDARNMFEQQENTSLWELVGSKRYFYFTVAKYRSSRLHMIGKLYNTRNTSLAIQSVELLTTIFHK